MKNNIGNEKKITNRNVLLIIITIIVICILTIGTVLLSNIKSNNAMNYSEINTQNTDKPECTSEENDEDTKDIKEFAWDSVKIRMNGKEYSFPMKVSDLANNGWSIQSSTNSDILDKTTNSIIEKFDNPDVIYYGYNLIYFVQNNLTLKVYFNLNQTDTKVIDTDVIAMEVTKTDDKVDANIDLNGLGFDKKLIASEAKRIFGDKNFSISDDTEYNTYKFFHEVNEKTYSIVYNTDMCSNEIKSVAINVEN